MNRDMCQKMSGIVLSSKLKILLIRLEILQEIR